MHAFLDPAILFFVFGVLAASAASAYAVPPPPNPASCWFYTDETYQTGYWAPCPPAP